MDPPDRDCINPKRSRSYRGRSPSPTAPRSLTNTPNRTHHPSPSAATIYEYLVYFIQASAASKDRAAVSKSTSEIPSLPFASRDLCRNLVPAPACHGGVCVCTSVSSECSREVISTEACIPARLSVLCNLPAAVCVLALVLAVSPCPTAIPRSVLPPSVRATRVPRPRYAPS